VRIAYLVNRYPAVSHTFIRREITALAACGVEVVRLSLRDGTAGVVDPADRVEGERTRVVLAVGTAGLAAHALGTLRRWPARALGAARLALRLGRGSDRGVPRHLAYLVEACVLRRWLEEAGVEHVHAHFGTNAAAVTLLCRRLGGPPYSFTVHGPEEFERAPGLALDVKAEGAAFVVAVSVHGQRELARRCAGDVAARIHLVRCGLDATFLAGDVTPVPARRRLLFVGRLAAEKAPLTLLEAAARLARAGDAFELVMVGDGPLRVEVAARVAALGLRDRVTMTGALAASEVRRQIEDARALVLPSVAEGLPVVLMEAMARGRPVIATDVGGVPELVEPGVSGWLVPARAIEPLAAAMREALAAPAAVLERLGRTGAARVARQHDVGAAAAALAQLFDASIRGGGRPVRGADLAGGAVRPPGRGRDAEAPAGPS
jgi:glycosyltransferase involved in cell wall biosynthesis